ncbi:hypothetical protein F4553_001596 [Allocatelliglobosispora scoriae]|uniref:Lipoprotein n=1 Tax=Allocatelliglobosispora scoriae TaxID=643052 RepID=A0A841BGK6_9ACTN|nr:hypothetical protein [Allocatelliglobosispora scoriae]MBB5868217.1 hypothetical protein [Allocatelliglobosispora scoriae]
MRRMSAVLLATLTLLTGCQAEVAPPSVGSPPAGADALVLRVSRTPGFGPPGARFAAPVSALVGDGRFIVLAPADGTPPAPVQRQLTTTGVTKVVTAAAGAGLQEQTDYGDPGAPDAPVTTFTLVTDGIRHDNTVIAFPTDADRGLNADQRARRERLRAFHDDLADPDRFLGGEAGGGKPYGYARLAIFALPTEMAADTRPWPLDDLATAGTPLETGRCSVVSGAQLATLRDAATGGSATQTWRSGERAYLVILRALLPDEDACPV